MYIIERYYWKLNEKATPFEEEKDKRYLLNKDSDRNLRFDDEEILWSPTTWLNGRIMDVRSYEQMMITNQH